MTTCIMRKNSLYSPVPVQVKSKIELRNVVEDSQRQRGEDQAEQEEEANTSLVEIFVRKVRRTVSRDVVAKSDGCQRDEDKVECIQNRPLRLKHVEEDRRDQYGEHQEDGAHQCKVDQSNLQFFVKVIFEKN